MFNQKNFWSLLISAYSVKLLKRFTDASNAAIRGVLQGYDDDDRLVGVVGYFSKSLDVHQRRYLVYDEKLFVIVESLWHFRIQIADRHVVVHTDHVSLRHLLLQKQLHPRIMRWLDTLSEYDAKITHISRLKNKVAD